MAVGAADLALLEFERKPVRAAATAHQPPDVIGFVHAMIELQNHHVGFAAVDAPSITQCLEHHLTVARVGGDPKGAGP
jgi:hypothetical protein